MAGKRKDYLSWNEFFMSISLLTALMNNYNDKGVCIVDSDNRIISSWSDSLMNSNDILSDSDNYSAIFNALYTFRGRIKEFKDSTIYTTHFPTYTESKQIVQLGIKKVIYLINDLNEIDDKISKSILMYGNVEIEPYYCEYSIAVYKKSLHELLLTIKKHIGISEDKSLSKSEYFMSVAAISALRSKDPSTQVGACLVDSKSRILSVGYNGAPFGFDDELLPWDSIGEEVGDLLNTKNPYVVHAEMNTFNNYRGNQDDLEKSTLYLLYSPCLDCTRRISLAQIDSLVYLRGYTKNNILDYSDRMLKISNIKSIPYCDKQFTKEKCNEFLKETNKVLKKNIEK